MAVLLLLCWYLGLPALLIFDYLNNAPFFTGWDVIPYLWSISLYFWMLGNVILGSKVPLFQKLLPYDKRIKFHILASLGIILGFTIHFLSKIITGEEMDILAWILLLLVSALFLISAFWVKIPLLSWYRIILIKIIKTSPDTIYDPTRILHGIFFPLAAGIMFFHVQESGIEAQGSWISSYGYLGAFITAAAIYTLSMIRKVLRVKAVLVGITERQGVSILKVRPVKPINYRAGQFAFLSFPGIPGLGRSHPFSYLSSPETETSRIPTIWFAVKDSGDFTGLIKNLKPGSRVTIDGSYGDFRPRDKDLTCLIGTGIGAVPVLSLLGDKGFQNADTFAILGCDGKEDLPWVEDLHPPLQNPRIRVLEYKKTGQLVDQEELQKLPGNIKMYKFYLCCSPGVRKNIINHLRTMGVPMKNIIFENFAF